ncbi:hypothetical protein [Ottowia massiliensis]|uniref:hypothetical protein n=1 Tax=Ottowia massiliensis TaxID=2045302 RepID=UPI000C82EEA0|nr:hypothetical protein [Ottowia massiliensis]
MRHPAPAAEQTAPPSFQALLINTLTLMTGYAQTPAGTFHRSLLAGQVAQQLGELAARPRISPAMRALFMRLAGEWVLLAPAAEAAPAQPAGGTGRHSPAGVQ